MNRRAFQLYLLFTCSWFLHLPSRLEFLGAIRFDLVLILLITVLIWTGQKKDDEEENEEEPERAPDNSRRVLAVLLACSIVTAPFVEWPGSVLVHGIPNLIKAIVFYYFTVLLVTTETRLKVFVAVFIACQSLRVVEPVYLHLADGYWGDTAYMMGEYMDRLSGAPHDVINPNGLAFIIVSVLPFVYYLSSLSLRWAIPMLSVTPVLLYALALTGSRSGFVAILAAMAGIMLKSQRKAMLAVCFAVLVVGAFFNLNEAQQDRYASIFDSGAKNAATVEGRKEGVIQNFETALRRPLFGHGLGTSREANAHFSDVDKPAHNLYAEIAQELGLVGLVIFLFFMKTVVGNIVEARKKLTEMGSGKTYLSSLADGIQVWVLVTFLFSLVSYGLSSYEWYLAAGLSAVVRVLATRGTAETEGEAVL